MANLDGRVAIVTGGSRGLGEAIVREFVSQGAKVAFGDVLLDEGKALESELGESVKFFELDVTSEEQWTNVVKETEAAFGPVDILVNNAGIVFYKSVEEMTFDEYRKVIDVNQFGTFLGMHHVVPSMKKTENGRIINVSSVEGIRALPGGIAYEASKFAVRGMTKSAAIDLGQYNILVNSLHPGPILTPMLKSQIGDSTEMFESLAIKRGGDPKEYAKTVAFMASVDSSYATGSEFVLDGGMTAVL